MADIDVMAYISVMIVIHPHQMWFSDTTMTGAAAPGLVSGIGSTHGRSAPGSAVAMVKPRPLWGGEPG